MKELDIDTMLSDDFFEYTEKLKEIHQEIKSLELEMRDAYQKHKEKVSALKQQALDLQKELLESKTKAE